MRHLWPGKISTLYLLEFSAKLGGGGAGESRRKLSLSIADHPGGKNQVKQQQKCQGKQKSETELTASVLKKRSKTHKRLKRTLFNRTKQDKTCNFRGSPLFLSYIQHKKVKTLSSLRLCQFEAGMLAEGKGQQLNTRTAHHFYRGEIANTTDADV